MNDIGDLILRENRIALLSIYRSSAVNFAQSGDLGLTKMKALLRSKVFFFYMDKITAQVLGPCASRKSVTISQY